MADKHSPPCSSRVCYITAESDHFARTTEPFKQSSVIYTPLHNYHKTLVDPDGVINKMKKLNYTKSARVPKIDIFCRIMRKISAKIRKKCKIGPIPVSNF